MSALLRYYQIPFLKTEGQRLLKAWCMPGQEEPDDDEAGPDEHHGEDAAKRAMQLRGLPVSRGSLLDGSVAAAHRLEIGICATDRGNGEEILQV